MANEITVSLSLEFSKGGSSDKMRKMGQQFTLSGTDYIHKTQIVGTSEEAIVIGEIGTPGWCFFRNLDDTNYVSIRAATGATSTVELKAGESCCFRLARGATAPFAIANTSSVTIEYLILED
jgi:hypothetical protein